MFNRNPQRLLMPFISALSTKNTHQNNNNKNKERHWNQQKGKRKDTCVAKDIEAETRLDYFEQEQGCKHKNIYIVKKRNRRQEDRVMNKMYNTRALVTILESAFICCLKQTGLTLFPELNSSLASFHVQYQTFQYHSEESTVAHSV